MSRKIEDRYERLLLPLFDRFEKQAVAAFESKARELAVPTVGIDLEWLRVWLDKTIEEVVIKPSHKAQGEIVKTAYRQGVTWADTNLSALTVGAKLTPGPIDWRALDVLKARNTSLMTKLGADLNAGIIEGLTEGLMQGESIPHLAKRIQNAVQAIGRTRAETIARTETMYAVNQGTLIRYSQAGVRKVRWLTGLDERACFPGNVKVMTKNGNVPICHIQAGDEVLTPAGYCRVSSTMSREYCGPLTRVKTERGRFVCTSDHPVYVVGEGWVCADQIKVGELLKTADDQPAQVSSVEYLPLTEPDHGPPTRLQISILSRVLFGIGMPVGAVDLDHDPRGRYREVDRIPADGRLLNEIDTNGRQRRAELCLQCGLSAEPAPTGKGAEPPAAARDDPDRLAARLAGRYDRGASAFLGAIRRLRSIVLLDSEDFPTPGAGLVSSGREATGPAADGITVGIVGINEERLSTDRAQLLDLLGFGCPVEAFARAIQAVRAARVSLERLTTSLTHLRNAAPLARPATHRGTIFSPSPTGVKLVPTILTLFNHLQDLTVFDKIRLTMLGSINVYNLSVENSPVYFANGHLVHNCPECESLHGNEYEIGSVPALPVHPNCRCTVIPVIEVPK
jgi:hypothetical protein